jgi:hypothetical protein
VRWWMDEIEGRSVDDDRTLLRDLRNGAELSIVEGRLVRGSGYEAALPETRRALARTGAILRLRQRNRYFVHASGVVDPDGRAVVFVGESGSGKSTLAFALVRAGWTLLGDDGVVLEPGSPDTIVHGWRSPLLVSAALADYFPELREPMEATIPGDARRRSPWHVKGSTRATLGALVFVTQARNGRLCECGESEALMLLVRQSPWVLLGDRFTQSHFTGLRRIVASAPLFSFSHGPEELVRVAELFESALETILPGAII